MSAQVDIGAYKKVVFLTGAGISVASGLRPYRGPGGLWEEAGTKDFANASAIETDPAGVWRLFGGLRALALAAGPNAAHLALAEIERSFRTESRSVTVITQNVDGLHQRAGSNRVIEVHGSAFRTRCANGACPLPPFHDEEPHDRVVPRCTRCMAVLRPDVVFFDEPIPVDAEWETKQALRDCDLFVAIGTSGTVSPASNYVRSAEYEGARTILVNLQPMSPRNPHFREEVLGKAEEVLPRLFGLV